MRWTKHESERALDMAARFYTRKEIADALGKTRNSVCGHIWRIENAHILKKNGPCRTWERRVFETWADRKTRQAKERQQCSG